MNGTKRSYYIGDDMSDITTAIWQGFQMGHLMDQEKRLRELQALQVAALEEKQRQEAQMRQVFQQPDIYQPGSFAPAQIQDKYGLTSGGVSELTPGKSIPNLEKQSFLSQFYEKSRPVISRMLSVGIPWDQIESKFQKLPVQEKYMNVAEGGTIINPETREVIFQGQPKSAGERPAQVGFDDKIKKVVFRHPASGVMYTEDVDELGGVKRKPYKMTKQLKPIIEAAPLYQIIPGYQTPQGQPVPFSLRTGKPSVGGGLQKTPSESDVTEARKMTKVIALFDTMDKAFEQAKKSLPTSTLERIAGWPLRKIKVASQSDPELAMAHNLSEGMLSQWARNVQGETGVLTDQDTARARPLIWNINDTPKVRELKKQSLYALTLEIYNRGKRQQNPLGNAPGSNAPPFDVTVQPSGKYDYEYVPGKGLIKAR